MQKLKYIVLDRMISKKCTSAEIDFIIHISHYQDDTGCIRGVYYRDICRELEISYQKFYDLKLSLIEKNIIKANKEFHSDWDIQILDNDFTGCSFDGELNPKDRYINTSHNIFYDKDFFALKAGAKLLAMQFLKISFAGRGCYNIGTEKFFAKYMELFGVCRRAIQNYMTQLRKFFSIGIKEKLYWITPLTKVYKSSDRKDADAYGQHIGMVICRRQKIQYTKQTLKDTMDLLTRQYASHLKGKLNLFTESILDSLSKVNAGIRDKYKWVRKLQPKLIHKILREKIGDMDATTIFE